MPAQTVCNYWNYWWTLLPEHLTEQDPIGFIAARLAGPEPAGRADLDLDVDGAGGVPPVATTVPGEVETAARAATRASRPTATRLRPRRAQPGEFDPHELPILHANPAGPTGQNGSDCQPGQTGYSLGELQVPGQSDQNPAVDRAPTSPATAASPTSSATRTAPASCATPESRRGSHEDREQQAGSRTGRSA